MRGFMDTGGIQISKKLNSNQNHFIVKMRVLKDTDRIQISKKIEFKQKLVYSKNEGFNGHRWYSNFQEN